MSGGQFIAPGKLEIGQHAPKIEIDEARLRVEKKSAVANHLFEGNQPRGQFGDELFLLLEPLVQAAPPELALLEPDISEPLGNGDELPIVGIIQLEGQRFDLVLDMTPHKFLISV